MEVVKIEQFRIAKDCNYSGVYAIVNLKNHKVYIGSSRNIKQRLTNHKTHLIKNKHCIKLMQEDFNKGNRFIAYVVSKVRLREEKYCIDDDLRYFEHEAIIEFDALNPEKGYNMKDTPEHELHEHRNIHYSKQDLDYYFNMFNPNYPIASDGRKEEKKFFINKVLYNKRRF